MPHAATPDPRARPALRALAICLLLAALLPPSLTAQAQLLEPIVAGVEPQPLIAQAARLEEALRFVGSTLEPDDAARLAGLRAEMPSAATVAGIQEVLDRYVLAAVHINPEARVKVRAGPAEPRLVQGGWTTVLVKVHNEAGVRAPLEVTSPQAAPVLHPWHWSHPNHRALPQNRITAAEVENRFLEIAVHRQPPMRPGLSGQPVEYVILQLYSRDRGAREVRLEFSAGQGTQDLGFRGVLDPLFDVRPAVQVRFAVQDHDGRPTMGSFIISDAVQRLPLRADGPDRGLPADPRNRLAQVDRTGAPVDRDRPRRLIGVYPLPSRRVATRDEYPDFFFQPQVYRADGEHVLLPPGSYEVEYTRGPEYRTEVQRITVPEGVETHEERFRLQRWTDLSALGWHSADHHVHAAGCSHYESPEEGVHPEHMWRQVLGEELDLASVLTWGPGWYHQKQFFTGRSHPLSDERNVMRYDVEVSGFPSAHAGHLVLLGLSEDDYPGTRVIEDWPSWTLPVLQWARSQRAATGYAHSGWGLEPQTSTSALPNYVVPKMDGIGANEYVVTLAHGLVDFFSAGDTPPLWELNMWYHSLNAGFRPRLMGETDFPCIFDERIGLSRTYARFDAPITFERFLEAALAGRSYVSDGRAHLIDFHADQVELGTGESELRLAAPGEVTFRARVQAMLPESEDSLGALGPADRPYWSVVRARQPGTRRVPVELVVNGEPVERQMVEADGSWSELRFRHRIERSSWVALRVYPAAHTNPIWVRVGDQPVRPSRRSAEWLAAAVDRAWTMKSPAIRVEERPAARAAYDQARATYLGIAAAATGP